MFTKEQGMNGLIQSYRTFFQHLMHGYQDVNDETSNHHDELIKSVNLIDQKGKIIDQNLCI